MYRGTSSVDMLVRTMERQRQIARADQWGWMVEDARGARGARASTPQNPRRSSLTAIAVALILVLAYTGTTMV